jgi:hypothetical protein
VRPVGFAIQIARTWVSTAVLRTNIALNADIETELAVIEITDAANGPTLCVIQPCSNRIETKRVDSIDACFQIAFVDVCVSKGDGRRNVVGGVVNFVTQKPVRNLGTKLDMIIAIKWRIVV